MEIRYLVIISLIGVLFIGTVFFSGCSSDEIEAYLIKGKGKIDELTNKNSCEGFCSSEGYDLSSVRSDDKIYMGADCDESESGRYYCSYDITIFDCEEEDIDCDSNSLCVCKKFDYCGSSEDSCSKCTANGCTG